MDEMKEEFLWDAIRRRSERIQKLADDEEKAAILGLSAKDNWPEKERLLKQCDEILDKLESLNAHRT